MKPMTNCLFIIVDVTRCIILMIVTISNKKRKTMKKNKMICDIATTPIPHHHHNHHHPPTHPANAYFRIYCLIRPISVIHQIITKSHYNTIQI